MQYTPQFFLFPLPEPHHVLGVNMRKNPLVFFVQIICWNESPENIRLIVEN